MLFRTLLVIGLAFGLGGCVSSSDQPVQRRLTFSEAVAMFGRPVKTVPMREGRTGSVFVKKTGGFTTTYVAAFNRQGDCLAMPDTSSSGSGSGEVTLVAMVQLKKQCGYDGENDILAVDYDLKAAGLH